LKKTDERNNKLALKENGVESSSTELNFFGGGTVVEGTIRANNSVRIDGRIKGKLICKNTLTIGVNGEIEGDVEAKNAIVGGKIKGKIKVAEKLVLEAKSILIGDLKASKLLIDEGAVFEGTSDMGKKEPTETESKPLPTLNKQTE
jgi:cytoskeletal protein CcmA (bactofilin family)